jgi:hypothetical protein
MATMLVAGRDKAALQADWEAAIASAPPHVAEALRSLRELHNLPGRWDQAETYFDPELRPGTLIEVARTSSGTARVLRIERISGGSVAGRFIQFYAREIS